MDKNQFGLTFSSPRTLFQLNFPIWFNADILSGPGSSKEPLPPDIFLHHCQSYFPFFTLSLGWTTGFDPEKPLKYNSKHIEDMLQAINTIIQSDHHSWFTFPVRTALALNSLPELEHLLERGGPNTTLTLWTAEGDTYDSSKLYHFIDTIGRKRVYVDLPPTWKNREIQNSLRPLTPIKSQFVLLSWVLWWHNVEVWNSASGSMFKYYHHRVSLFVLPSQ